ncbi:unnamed protein product [Ambrosiozyma monospora]|uniref:Unnamed protein product n=1 Tax=Ambrosiozyma monospora TaxID=43982 RepID=A0A9W6Z2P4_AMBMO|nr:unnamed protein product [Ambrosiozyma monospora]
MGYIKKGSVPSLIAGTSLSAVYLTAGYLLHENKEYGIHTALFGSSVLLLAGLSRSIKVSFKKPVPLTLLGLGCVSTGYYAKRYADFYL